jgi:uncharacterized membrane protein YhaH (DUF805 family)
MKLSDILSAPFWSDAKFYFALFAAFVIFAQRFGLVLTAQEIASVNLVIAVAFGIAPPSVQWMQTRALNRRIKDMERQGVAGLREYDGLRVGK